MVEWGPPVHVGGVNICTLSDQRLHLRKVVAFDGGNKHCLTESIGEANGNVVSSGLVLRWLRHVELIRCELGGE